MNYIFIPEGGRAAIDDAARGEILGYLRDKYSPRHVAGNTNPKDNYPQGFLKSLSDEDLIVKFCLENFPLDLVGEM
ncbi:MAG: hypothetical protein ABI721_02940 [Candidatus Dojkabacteria bacterium]